MTTSTSVTRSWHTVVPTALGELTLVRDADALLGLYFPHHWYRPNPVTFGPRRDDEFDEAVGQLGEYLVGQRQEFDLALATRGDEFQRRVWNLVRQIPSYGHTVTYGALAGRLGGEAGAQQVGAATTTTRPVPRHRHPHPARPRAGVHHPRPTRAVRPWLVGRTRTARRVGHPVRPAVHPRTRLPRRHLTGPTP